MNKLEQYLDSIDKTQLTQSIYNNYELFGYNDEELFKFHLDFMLENLYNITLVETKRKRLKQKEFRKELLKKFKTCIVTGNDCEYELEAAHIIPITNDENYDINNGLLLERNIHNTFDRYNWSINPDTLIIEINNNINVGSIRKYNNTKINIELNTELKQNLQIHYNIFKQKLQ